MLGNQVPAVFDNPHLNPVPVLGIRDSVIEKDIPDGRRRDLNIARVVLNALLVLCVLVAFVCPPVDIEKDHPCQKALLDGKLVFQIELCFLNDRLTQSVFLIGNKQLISSPSKEGY